ncbi:hypothetical protein DKX38_019936 [Salix brachista]|uniref:Nucleoside phosphorylase domain-containing protein n=1 Tax=Salix brachista TaxID=2182728 RepID=A0A5N5KHN2_9ROSI|nr:hypothetical protein DKX38_019936 [Salix brachista]
MSRIDLAVLLVLGLLLVTAKQSMQMSLRNPNAEIETSSCKLASLRLGLVLRSDNSEKALLDSDFFEPDSENPDVDIAGRRFHVGTLNKTPIMYVKTGTHSVNVATAVKTLLLTFHIFGIIFFGSSGSLDKDILMPGDVAVPKAVAFTGVWEWKKFRSKNRGKLVFGDFNYPENGENLLGTAEQSLMHQLLIQQTSLSNKKLFVVLQGVSNVAGGKSSNSGIKYIASYTAFLAATKFINSIPTPRLACE